MLDLADTQTPQGIIAVIQKEEVGLPDLHQGKFLFLEDVQDPGNVGTMIRTADAAGFTGVIVSDKSADIYSLKTCVPCKEVIFTCLSIVCLLPPL